MTPVDQFRSERRLYQEIEARLQEAYRSVDFADRTSEEVAWWRDGMAVHDMEHFVSIAQTVHLRHAGRYVLEQALDRREPSMERYFLTGLEHQP